MHTSGLIAGLCTHSEAQRRTSRRWIAHVSHTPDESTRRKCPPHHEGILVDNATALDLPIAPSFAWLPSTPSGLFYRSINRFANTTAGKPMFDRSSSFHEALETPPVS